MILTHDDLKGAIAAGEIVFEGGKDDLIGTNSIDVRLSYIIYKVPSGMILDPQNPPELSALIAIDISQNDGFQVEPHTLYLGSTIERIGSDFYRATMEGKSSLARLGIAAHWCAGYGDVGFSGHWTLEIVTTNPTILRAGMKIAQIEFTRTSSIPEINYKKRGRYSGVNGLEASKGV